MNTIKVREMMIPLADLPTVSMHANLIDAVKVLEKDKLRFDPKGHMPGTVVVVDENQRVVGKIDRWDVLRSLEPKYQLIGNVNVLSSAGWKADFLKSMVKNFGLFQNTLANICTTASQLKAEDIMTPFSEEEMIHHERETVEADESLAEAVHLFVMGGMMILFVTEGMKTVGVLRLSDVCQEICGAIKGCEVEA